MIINNSSMYRVNSDLLYKYFKTIGYNIDNNLTSYKIEVHDNESFDDALRRYGFKNILSREESEALLNSVLQPSKAEISLHDYIHPD